MTGRKEYMIFLYDFGWNMTINFEFLCDILQNGSYRKEGIKAAQLHRIFRMIEKYADAHNYSTALICLERYPKARAFFLGKGKK